MADLMKDVFASFGVQETLMLDRRVGMRRGGGREVR